MPLYEYSATDENNSCSHCRDRFEIRQSILEDPLTVCPECGCEVRKLVSLPAGHITLGREMNTYGEVRHAKYWRDKNGDRHRVTDADGYRTSPSVSRRVRSSPQEIEQKIKKDREATSKRLSRIRHYYRKKD